MNKMELSIDLKQAKHTNCFGKFANYFFENTTRL